MSTELIKVEEFTSIMQTAPDTLSRNQMSVEKGNTFGQTLIDTIEANGGLNDALDAQVANYLEKIKVTKTNMEVRRKPITQIFDQVRKVFTSLESDIDLKSSNSIPGKLYAMRNQYATKKFEEEKRKKAEAIRIQNIENEKATYKSGLELALNNYFNDYFNSKSNLLSQVWSSINYANYTAKAETIHKWSLIYPVEHFNIFRDTTTTFYLDPATKSAIKTEVMSGKYESFAQQYKFDMEDLRQSFIDRLPSLQKELTETEALRKTNTEAAQKAEEERRKREEQERAKRDLEAKQVQEKQKANVQAAAQVNHMTSLFDSAAASMTAAPVKAKVTEKIKVLHPAGILEIYQMWWMNEGQSLPIDELEKIHKKMITFCEKRANKEEEHIKSQYVQYVDDVKAK